MNAHTSILPPALDRYGDTVRSFMPGVEGRELELRCRLLLARDTAAFALKDCSDASTGVLQEIQRLGILYAFAPMPADRLQMLLEGQRHLLRASACFDQFADVEGDGARGE